MKIDINCEKCNKSFDIMLDAIDVFVDQHYRCDCGIKISYYEQYNTISISGIDKYSYELHFNRLFKVKYIIFYIYGKDSVEINYNKKINEINIHSMLKELNKYVNIL